MEVARKILEEGIDYDAFTFEEISRLYEEACNYGYYGDSPGNIFTRLFDSAALARKVALLPGRRCGYAFI
jgi:hypothetical protein